MPAGAGGGAGGIPARGRSDRARPEETAGADVRFPARDAGRQRRRGLGDDEAQRKLLLVGKATDEVHVEPCRIAVRADEPGRGTGPHQHHELAGVARRVE